ncbi:unnamed protein product [Parascedosporium putredinis]|uniref:FAD linked oxidase N-terminal domain-containing protein n=1 Tax=Parascedosporium putredinis TaxID=1442378 RepID=A0A9P1HA80_9PEZI|nr:unnamed protein product [Parascedosporium putredinis]CAI8002394.1 unnamed protein product [Parascedosporium putredinis]
MALPGILSQLSHPKLQWRPRSYLGKRTLTPSTISHYDDVDSLRDAISSRSRREVYLITRVRTTATSPPPSDALNGTTPEPPPIFWVVFKYRNRTFFQVPFQKILLDGLPLGGHPLTPGPTFSALMDTLARLHGVPWIESVVPLQLANNGRHLVWTPKIMLCPSIDDLSPTLAWVRTGLLSNHKIKAGGSLHSWSRVAMTSDVHILPDNLKLLQRAQDEAPHVYAKCTTEGKEPGLEALVRGGSGNTIREVNKFAWELGLAFPVLSGFDGQTLGGMFNTGTHGSVMTSSHLADAIVSIDLVRRDGKFIRIEPASASGAVTDPSAFLVHFPNARLIQNDEYFNAALINMGTMGVPAYHFELLINPHSDKVVVTTRHPLALSPSEDAKFSFQPPGRDLIRTLEMPARFSRPAFSTWFQERWGSILIRTVDTLIAVFPSLVPRLNDSALQSLINDAYIDRSFNVFNIGAGTNAIPALACTIYVPLADDQYLVALEAVRQRARQLANQENSCAFEFIFTASTGYAQEVVDGYDAAVRVALSGLKKSDSEEPAEKPIIDEKGASGNAPVHVGDAVRVHWGQMMRDPGRRWSLGCT